MKVAVLKKMKKKNINLFQFSGFLVNLTRYSKNPVSLYLPQQCKDAPNFRTMVQKNERGDAGFLLVYGIPGVLENS